MRVSFIVALILISRPLHAGELKACPGPDTSTHYEACMLIGSTNELDAKLTSTYRVLLGKFSGAAERSAFVESQSAWRSYREKTCEFENRALGGANSISWARCQNRLVRERLAYFNELLN